MYTDSDIRRLPVREFRAGIRSDMDLPLVVTADGEDAFAVIPMACLREMLEKAAAHENCPYCRFTASLKALAESGRPSAMAAGGSGNSTVSTP